MAIVLTLPTDFDVENYTGLQAFLTDHLQLDQSTVDQLPNLIRLAEYRLARLIRTQDRQTETTLSATSGAQAVALPSDFKQPTQLKINGDSDSGYPLTLVSLNTVEAYDYPGEPLVYAVSGSSALLGPIPDAAYTLTLRYLAKLTPLTEDAPTNWLLTSHADAYVYMAASVISFHLGDKALASEYAAFADGVCEEINKEGVRQRFGANLAPMVRNVP